MSDQSPELQSATSMKLATARQKKDTGDQAFKQGNVKGALFSYHEALMYLLGLDKNALESIGIGSAAPPKDKDGKEVKEKTEVDELIEKIYANMSACHMKNENWKRAALAKNENNYKAKFRKGKALGEMGFYEKAVKVLEDVKEKNPSDGAIVDAELARLRVMDNERERVHNQKLKGFLNRADKKATAMPTPAA
ncbi:hypothetical protein D9615_004410 [Tricholomella constricta]|uniref:TPR-like protein n=1 Tax=Tricholomella constricta TaxID=117010 RepID=A0A8H5HEF5_9AGAR|nr:hypothetical protein D9615_004410 [Tricholomella constricta]